MCGLTVAGVNITAVAENAKDLANTAREVAFNTTQPLWNNQYVNDLKQTFENTASKEIRKFAYTLLGVSSGGRIYWARSPEERLKAIKFSVLKGVGALGLEGSARMLGEDSKVVRVGSLWLAGGAVGALLGDISNFFSANKVVEAAKVTGVASSTAGVTAAAHGTKESLALATARGLVGGVAGSVGAVAAAQGVMDLADAAEEAARGAGDGSSSSSASSLSSSPLSSSSTAGVLGSSSTMAGGVAPDLSVVPPKSPNIRTEEGVSQGVFDSAKASACASSSSSSDSRCVAESTSRGKNSTEAEEIEEVNDDSDSSLSGGLGWQDAAGDEFSEGEGVFVEGRASAEERAPVEEGVLVEERSPREGFDFYY
jgi:hypothetical protein